MSTDYRFFLLVTHHSCREYESNVLKSPDLWVVNTKYWFFCTRPRQKQDINYILFALGTLIWLRLFCLCVKESLNRGLTCESSHLWLHVYPFHPLILHALFKFIFLYLSFILALLVDPLLDLTRPMQYVFPFSDVKGVIYPLSCVYEHIHSKILLPPLHLALLQMLTTAM